MSENLTTFTQVDPGTVYSTTTSRLTVTSQPRDADGYVYYDFGAEYFGVGIQVDGSFYADSSSSNGGFLGLFALGNRLDDLKGVVDAGTDDQQGVYIYFTTNTEPSVRLNVVSDSTWNIDPYTVSANTLYYYRYVRNRADGKIYLGLYSSAANRDAEISAIGNLELPDNTVSFRYLLLGQTYNSGSAGLLGTGYIQDVVITEQEVITVQFTVPAQPSNKSYQHFHEGAVESFGDSAYVNSLALPHQVGCTFDGYYHHGLFYSGNGTAASQPLIGVRHPSGICSEASQMATTGFPAVTRGFHMSMSGGYGVWNSNTIIGVTTADSYLVGLRKGDNSFKRLYEISGNHETTDIKGITQQPCSIIDKNRTNWISGGTATEAICAKGDVPNNSKNFDVAVVLRTYSDALTSVQSVAYESGDVGHLYANGTSGARTLYYRHWTFGSKTAVISGASKATTCVLTVGTGHGVTAESTVDIDSIVGMVELNDSNYRVLSVSATTIELDVNSTGFTTYTSGGTAFAVGVMGAEETVATDLSFRFTFRGAVSRDNKLIVVYREYHASVWDTLRYNTRISGTMGTSADFCTDISGSANSSGYFTSCANLGEDTEVIVYYIDSTSGDLVSRTWDGSTVSAQSALKTIGTIVGGYITAPDSSVGECGIMYHETISGTDYIKIYVDALSTTPQSTNGVLLAEQGDTTNGTFPISQQSATNADGTVTAFSFFGADGFGYIGLWDVAGKSWLVEPEKTTHIRYWDGHNTITIFVDGDDYLYIAYGGRSTYNNVDDSTVLIKRLTQRLNTNVVGMSWSDVSPTGIIGRGYKFIKVDNYGIPYLFFIARTYGNEGPMQVTALRDGAWETPYSFVRFDANPSNTICYINDIELGEEVSGQKSFHITYSYRDIDTQPSIAAGSVMQIKLFYMKLIPDGAGGYTAKKASGTSQTLPATDANADTVYSAVSSGDYLRLYAGVGVMNTSDPLIAVSFLDRSSPYEATDILAFYYSGGWTSQTIESSNLDQECAPTVTVTDVGTVFVSASRNYSGISEIVNYTSKDDGVTWATGTKLTGGSSFDNFLPLITPRSNTTVSVVYQQRVSRLHSEVIFDTLQLVTYHQWLSMQSLDRQGGPISARRFNGVIQ